MERHQTHTSAPAQPDSGCRTGGVGMNPTPRPATKDNPRHVSQDAIDAFETGNPALKGIGKAMVALGVWIVSEPQEAST